MRTSKEIIEIGATDPEMISLMGFFEEDVGPDTISDFTTRVIIEHLAAITEEFCEVNNIPVQPCDIGQGHKLPIFTKSNSRQMPLEPIQKEVESVESVVIRYVVPLTEGGTRCGRQNIAECWRARGCGGIPAI
jgi:hypothetical protein